MCGQFGILMEDADRFPEQVRRLTHIFTDLMLLSEARGFHATGVGLVNRDGQHCVHKRPVPAHEFAQDPQYHAVLSQLDSRTTLLIGHTRWKTQGTQYDNRNNHPLETGKAFGTANGHIANAAELFAQLRLPRRAQVDSEIIFRIADTAAKKGHINTKLLASRLSLCRGHMSAVISTWRDPETVVVVKGDRPLEFRYHARRRVLVYASEGGFLDSALAGERGWKEVQIPAMSLTVFDCRNLMDYHIQPFSFDVTGEPVQPREVRRG